ncbi:hypothetical protein DEU56DRAFT_821298 [Suillus clintonianus]|uniref:uncharacterized protein n=1 Tax=Suillus clintonianus TaxID=1904413 RepID=UPI001B874A47|nr:uncharacterized protein DEU56DRAFT_821298 [Suillus clintonianus]KAG2127125.1 hypothetical protein DEU56DRAFT_821298 [Suillus clintonianus]
MPPPRVKNVVKDFVKDFGKVFAIRLRRSTKNGHTQCSSTTTDHEGDVSILGHTSSLSPTLSSNSSQVHAVSANEEPGLEASTNASSPRSSRGVALARKASDMAQLALPLVQAVASAIPLVGAPMQAAIGGLVTGLQAIDRHNQNKADLDGLTLRLDRLSRELCNASPALDPVEQSRRDSFVRMLEDTSARVTALHERCLASTPVTQAIAGCFIEIDRYLADYLWSSQMQSQRDIREVLVILQRERDDRQKLLMTIENLVTHGQFSLGPTATQLIGTATRGCVTLIDATDCRHPISVNFCTSFEQFNEMLKALFKCNSAEAQIQRRYMESGKYDLCIDEGPRVTQLTSHQWSRLEAGTTIVMRVIIEQQMSSSSQVSYECPCGAMNTLGIESMMYSFGRQADCSIDCRTCKRRFQVSRVPSNPDRIALPSDIDSDAAPDTEMDLIRNFHVRQTEDLAAAPPWLIPAIRLINDEYLDDKFEVVLRRPAPRAMPMWWMKCLDCPGKVRAHH